MLFAKNAIAWLKSILGFPAPPQPWQIGEKYITMRCPGGRDCHNPMVATLCGVTYEEAHKALWHFNLPFFLESPLISNPLNVKRGIRKLGFEPVEIGLSPLLNGTATPGKVGVLVHDPENPNWAQHWVVWMGLQVSATGDELLHALHWGQSQQLVYKTQHELIDLVTLGTPNCVFEVRKKK